MSWRCSISVPRHSRPVGASVLSGAGSLPLHLMPLIVPVLVIGGRLSLADAGLVATAVLLGQLAAALILPVFDVRTIGRAQAVVLAIALLAGLCVTGIDGAATLLLGWFVVGMCCGGFQYLGTITAALHWRPAFAFPIRLGVVLAWRARRQAHCSGRPACVPIG